MSDSTSPKAEQVVIPNRAPTPPTQNVEDNIKSVPTTNQNTILVPASEEETAIAIDALLSLGQDLNIGVETDLDENDLLQPIAPGAILPDPAPMVAEINSDDTEILDQEPISENEQNQAEVKPKPEDPKPTQRKGKLVVQNYKLARNYKHKRRFSCMVCAQKFVNNKDLNNHFKDKHPP